MKRMVYRITLMGGLLLLVLFHSCRSEPESAQETREITDLNVSAADFARPADSINPEMGVKQDTLIPTPGLPSNPPIPPKP